MSKVYHLEINGQHLYYTTLSGLCSTNNIGVSKFTLDRYDFKEPYRNDICVIRKGVLNSGVKTKLSLPEIKKHLPKELPLHGINLHTPKQTNLKVNILPNQYIKKDQYYFNIDGQILDEKEFLNRYGKKYNLPKKTFGDIDSLLC